MVIAIVLLLLVIGSVVFHFVSPWWWTPIASNWGYIDDTIIITFWVTGAVFVGVILFMVWCLYRFRYRPDRRAAYEPENKKLEWWLTGLTALGVAVMLAPGLFVWDQYVTVPDDAVDIEVVGQQWQWNFRYPGADGVLGNSDARIVSYDNPFGLDPADPAAQDDILIEGGDLHLPLDQPIRVLNRSLDVLHDFYVPQFRAKMDMVPGMITYFWFTPIRTGTFDILCAELCGEGHYLMRSQVVVETVDNFDAWLAEQSTFAELYARTGNGAGERTEVVMTAPPATASGAPAARP